MPLIAPFKLCSYNALLIPEGVAQFKSWRTAVSLVDQNSRGRWWVDEEEEDDYLG